VQGFQAAAGWDATTGWGTPNVANLAQMLMNMSPPPPSNFAWGPDVSSAQGAVTWSSVQAAGATFAFAQASQGTGYTDPQFAANWQGISSAGLTRGAYHYGNPCNSGGQEATNFVNVMQAQGMLSTSDLLVLNIQTPCSNPPDGSIQQYITNFLNQVSQAFGSSNLIIYTRMFPS
jgi:lysozyme